MPSRKRASANFLSVLNLPCTNSLKSFAFAIVSLCSVPAALTRLVILPIHMGRIDVALLSLFASAGQKDNDRLAIPPEINSIAGTEIDAIFEHAISNAFDVGEVTLLDPGKGADDPGAGYRIEIREPFCERAFVVSRNIVADLKHAPMVA